MTDQVNYFQVRIFRTLKIIMKDIKPIKKDGKWIDVLTEKELIPIKKTKKHLPYGIKLHNEGMILTFKKDPENFDDYLNNEKKRVIILEMFRKNKSTKEIILQLEKKKIHFGKGIQKEIKGIKNALL